MESTTTDTCIHTIGGHTQVVHGMGNGAVTNTLLCSGIVLARVKASLIERRHSKRPLPVHLRYISTDSIRYLVLYRDSLPFNDFIF